MFLKDYGSQPTMPPATPRTPSHSTLAKIQFYPLSLESAPANSASLFLSFTCLQQPPSNKAPNLPSASRNLGVHGEPPSHPRLLTGSQGPWFCTPRSPSDEGLSVGCDSDDEVFLDTAITLGLRLGMASSRLQECE